MKKVFATLLSIGLLVTGGTSSPAIGQEDEFDDEVKYAIGLICDLPTQVELIVKQEVPKRSGILTQLYARGFCVTGAIGYKEGPAGKPFETPDGPATVIKIKVVSASPDGMTYFTLEPPIIQYLYYKGIPNVIGVGV